MGRSDLVQAHDRRPVRLIAVLVAAVGLVGGCAVGGAPTSSDRASLGTPAPSVAGATPIASIDASPSLDGQGTVLTEDDKGHIVVVKVGDAITVVLHSTYWSPASTSNAAIVAPVAAATVAPASPGTCLPGIGCGTVTSTFVAMASGEAALSASRTVCGEARNCQDVDKSWTVDLKVTP
jgi:hypothetical protein